MMYCGLDCSTTSSGVGVFEDDKLISYYCIKPKSKDWEERIGLFSIELNKILNKYPTIEKAFIEDLPLKDGKVTIKKLSCVRGAAKAILTLHNVELIPRSVNDWRQDASFFDGTRSGMTRDEMKKKAIEEVKRLFNIDVNDDVAEGILVGYRSVYPVSTKRFIGKTHN